MEDVVCVVCAQFEPQTWRKSLCKNCFHTDEEHTGDTSPTTSVKEGPDQKQKSSTGEKTLETNKEKVPSLKTSNGSKQISSSVSKVSPKSPLKSSTSALSTKFGPSLSKSKENVKNDVGKNGNKSASTPGKSSTEPTKRVPTTIGKQTQDVKAPVKNIAAEKKQNGIDIKSKTFSVKDTPTKIGQKVGDVKAGDVKTSYSNEAGCPVSKPEVSKSAAGTSSSRYIATGGVSKVKHLSKSFGTEEELDDAQEGKKACSDLDKHATRSDSDVTSKCQAGEGSQVTAKTFVIGKEKESVASSVVKTVPVYTGSSRPVKTPPSRSFDDGSSGNKSPSITISLRGGAADIKIGRTEQKSKLTHRVEDTDKERAREKEYIELKAKEKELLELKAKEKELLAKEKEYKELKARERDLRDLRSKERELKAKEKDYQVLLAKEKELEKLKCKEREIQDKENEIKNLKLKEQELRNLKAKENDIKAKETEIRKQEESLRQLKKKLSEMEKKCKELEEENTTLKRKSVHGPKEDAEKLLEELRSQLSSMENRCMKLEEDNTSLMTDLKDKEEAVKKDSHSGSKEMLALGHKFRESERDVSQVDDENTKLKREIRELREEMDEMYDTFRENEVDEFRDLQKELEITAKNCRILQFKLRKAERRNEQVENDKAMYEDRLRILQNQFESEDTRAHIRKVEEELKMAKEVSVRLHDEIDLLEDKKSKAEDDTRHLTELLEQADKKQFRMEMEIDKLRDQIMDLKQELKYAGKQESSDRKSSRQ